MRIVSANKLFSLDEIDVVLEKLQLTPDDTSRYFTGMLVLYASNKGLPEDFFKEEDLKMVCDPDTYELPDLKEDAIFFRKYIDLILKESKNSSNDDNDDSDCDGGSDQDESQFSKKRINVNKEIISPIEETDSLESEVGLPEEKLQRNAVLFNTHEGIRAKREKNQKSRKRRLPENGEELLREYEDSKNPDSGMERQ